QDDEERGISEKLIAQLENQGLGVVTRVLPMAPFWRAEEFHQDYYVRTGKTPYCHRYQKRF
ncbi:peptide-methionine (S)-S-oxide reductase, partial [Klebsiella quasipneumoniae]|uniref:peptide-methionine (S)-S-oxide reductase n=2 Tax=Gammaproteobacteria TaxID=1236 RepID=UPI00272FA310